MIYDITSCFSRMFFLTAILFIIRSLNPFSFVKWSKSNCATLGNLTIIYRTIFNGKKLQNPQRMESAQKEKSRFVKYSNAIIIIGIIHIIVVDKRCKCKISLQRSSASRWDVGGWSAFHSFQFQTQSYMNKIPNSKPSNVIPVRWLSCWEN